MINTDTWEQRKVSDVAKIIAGGTPSTKENSYWEPKEIPWLSSGEVHKKYITFTDDMISQIGMNNSSAKMVAKDSVLIALAGQGKTRGTVAINRIPLTTNQSIAAMTFNENFIPEFVFYNLENRYDELRRMSSGDGSRGGLNKQLVGDIEIPYTEKKEQERIGSFFESLDRIIALHQCKLFLNFAKRNDWEQRKFGTIINETRERTTTENEDTLLSCAIDGMFLNSELFSHFRGSSNIGYLKVKKNDLILSAQNLHLGNCNVNLRFEHGIISPAYKVYELIDSDPLFIQAWVKQDSTKDFFLKASTEGASVCRKNIVWEELYKQTLPIPKLEEQTKIGEYFSNLDNLITLHRRAYYNKKGGLTNVHNDNQQHYAIL